MNIVLISHQINKKMCRIAASELSVYHLKIRDKIICSVRKTGIPVPSVDGKDWFFFS
jgi:hypothetical protein